jgi:Putative phage serine protease XkdF
VSQSWSVSIPVTKDAAKRQITGFCSISTDAAGNLIKDLQGDQIPVGELEKAAHKLMLDGGRGKGGDSHERVGTGDIVESMVVTAEKRAALGFGAGPAGWVITQKIHDDALWAEIDRGDKLELSIHGTAKRDARDRSILRDPTVDEISVVDKGASGNHVIRPAVVLAKRLEDDDAPTWFTKFLARVGITKDSTMAFPPAPGGGTAPAQPVSLQSILDKLSPVEKAALEGMLAKAGVGGAPAPAAPAQGAAPAAPAHPGMPPFAKADLPEEIVKQLEERDELKKRVASLEDSAAQRELEDEVRKDMAHFPGKSIGEIASILKSAKKALPASEYDALRKSMASASAMVKQSGLLKELGSSAAGGAVSAEEEIKTIAKGLRQKDPTLNEAAAIAKAVDQNPELYARSRAEARGEG